MEANCNINVKNNFGMTPIIISLQHGVTEITDLLLKLNPDLDIVSCFKVRVKLAEFS